MFKLNRLPLLAIVLSLIITFVICDNKYTKAANEKKDSKIDLRTINQPFRMAKLNILWTKAQQVRGMSYFGASHLSHTIKVLAVTIVGIYQKKNNMNSLIFSRIMYPEV